jgi:hypothetical protein
MSKADKLRVPDYLSHILGVIQRIHLYVEVRIGAFFCARAASEGSS